ncbi:MAG: glycosyltransferase family 4 protein [candidate division WOR-3 bacterium]
MNILVINWQDIKNPYSGGAEVHLHQFFSSFAKRGHKVTLLCSSHKGLPDFEEIDGIRVIRKGNRWIFNFQVPFFFKSLLKNEDFDVIVEDVNKLPFFLRFFTKKPIIVVTHHFFDRVIFQETNPLFGLYVFLFEKLFFKFYKHFPAITVSKSTYEEMVRHGFLPTKVSIVYNALDLNFFTPGNKSDRPLIVYLGRLKKYKRIDLFLKVIKFLIERYPELELDVAVVGDGDARPQLESLTQKLGLGKCVRFLGFVSEREKVEILKRAWVIVNTSPKEGWGIVVMEAQACGTPAVVFNSPGLREAVKDGETGYIVPYGELEIMADRIREILVDSELRERLSKNARKWAEEFELSKLQETFYKKFFELLSK